MYIKRLELVNFKSFGKRVSIPFFEDFTAVSGPNGSGKSNIVDAVVFCLGLSSSRALRAEKLTDLIHSTDDHHPDHAEVSITLDNTDRRLPIDADELVITRKLRRTKSGYYSYCYLNSKSVPLSEIHRHLAKAGITSEGYNIVMQGDVTHIVSVTPTERRKIIDEIAGIAEFDEKKEKTLVELSLVRERSERVDVILDEVGMQLERLEDERSHALKYSKLREKKKLYEGYILLSALKDREEELGALRVQLEKLDASEQSLKERLEVAQAQLEAKREQLAALNEDIAKKGEKVQVALRLEIEELKGELARLNSAIESTQLQNSRLDERMHSIYHEIDQISESITDIDNQQEQNELTLHTLEGEAEEKLNEANALKERMASIDAEFEGVRDELMSTKEELEGERQNRAELVREQDRLLDAARRRSMEEHEIAEKIASAEQLIGSASQDSASTKEEMASVEREMKSCQVEADELDSKRARVQHELAAVEGELRGMQDRYAKLEMRVRAAEEGAGYSKPVERLLKARDRGELQGIYGTIAQLGRVDQRYALALEIAAGGRLQSIVVDSDADAAVCISYLKANRVGRATFLPLNKMERAKKLMAEKRGGIVDFAINLVDFDAKFAPAFWYVFRDTLVVEDMDCARALMGTHRIVTLGGELVERSGAMTGGHVSHRSVSFAASERQKLEQLAQDIREKEAERHTLIEETDSTVGLIEKTKREMAALDAKLSTLQMRAQEISTRRERLTGEIEAWKGQLDDAKKKKEQLKGSMEQLEEQLSEADASIHQLSEAVEKLEKQLSKSELPTISAQLDKVEGENSHILERIRDTEAGLRRLELDREYALKRETELKEQKAALEKERAENLEKVQESLQKTKKVEEKIASKEQELEQISKEIAQLQQERAALEKEVEEQREGALSLQMKLNESRGERRSLNEKKERLAREVEEAKAIVERENVDIERDVPPLEEVQQKIASTEKMMARLEPVNMRALEEYDSTLTRQRELKERRDVLEHEREEILQRIEHYEQMKKEEFMSTFNSINENFQRVFSELSDGVGTLVLENEDDPFAGGMSIKARPANKTLQRLEAMSGGEKSLTALSFIIAIQQHNPAPFYVFDEVDMFLDGLNAERVARLIHHSSEGAQFIVVSLRKPMIEAATHLVGVAMQEKDISYITGVKLKEHIPA
ncbi:MAG: chromosome segregation protein SMC [Methermicoccaceae archaeon]